MTTRFQEEERKAYLLSPREFQQELDTLKQKPRIERYALITQLPDRVVRSFEDPKIPQRTALQVYATEADRPCALLQVQSGLILLELLVTLGTDKARTWLAEGLRLEEFVVALEVPETNQLAVVQARLPSQPSAADLVRAVEEVKTRWAMRTQEEFAALLADVQHLVRVVELRPRKSLLPGLSVGETWCAVAPELPFPEFLGKR